MYLSELCYKCTFPGNKFTIRQHSGYQNINRKETEWNMQWRCSIRKVIKKAIAGNHPFYKVMWLLES